MHSIAPQSTIGQRVHAVFAQARFITFSLLLHVFIIIFGGTYVMYQQMADPPDFVAGGGEGLVIDEVGGSMPELPPEAPQVKMEPAIAAPSTSAAVLDALSTTSVSTNFAVNTIPVRGLAPNALSGGNGLSTQGIGEKIGQAGMGKAGGTSMVRFFGKTAEVQALVFVVDISTSMVQGKKSPKTYDALV